MKKIILSLFLGTAILATGCLKDDDYDNGAYGIVPTGDTRGIGFTKRSVSSGVVGERTVQNLGPVVVTANSVNPPTTGINYTITSNPALVTATDPTLTVLPASLFSFSASGTIEAGKWADTLDVKVLDASTLDPLKKYGIALTIATSDNGYMIAANSKTVIVTISIKNRYDGKYSLDGYHNRTPYTFPYVDVEMDMETTGPNSVIFYYVDVSDYGHPIGVGPGLYSWYGTAISPEITFDLATNNVTSVRNVLGSTAITLFTGPGSFPSRFDPVTKTIYVSWNYAGNPLRAFFDTLTYIGPR